MGDPLLGHRPIAYTCEYQTVALSDVLAIIGLVGGVIGFFVALSARKKADESERVANDARADAAAALARSADSGDRIAAAVEQMATSSSEPDVDFVRIFEDALNTKVEWAIEERADAHSYRLRNTGNVRAENVKISAVPPELAALLHRGDLGDLDAQKAGVFVTSSRASVSLHRVAVSWVEGGAVMSTELNLP
ncbi:hypothetical protein C5E02_11515 [Rathayibacter rathayi]|uniref:Uncharacterized protein n=1 Tax=Rathayibacter rathayi TaxID=33887 RepID=A0ABD6W8T4_RATRA|nr:hypothetical protein C1O28_11835 [Rathayibacter rathayi]SOE06013.1 hypothetical protein SAMN06295924_1234 [Rathayibacter rathayi NCPPB 2980 = VKM Ac-1601]PPF14343.1 hypothetical protein C5C04_07015 [Rathayibacter rathayi]PPF22218.1 hypothetical protein C5C34_12075 [Rathayibacter rathayi]PPF46714.1 hypothetical protein C5C08_11230 [Rathayibacter rathayi]